MGPFRSVRKSFDIVAFPYAHLVRPSPGVGHIVVPRQHASRASVAVPLPRSMRCNQSPYHLLQMRTIVSPAIPSVSHLLSAKLLVVAVGCPHHSLSGGIIDRLEASPYMNWRWRSPSSENARDGRTLSLSMVNSLYANIHPRDLGIVLVHDLSHHCFYPPCFRLCIILFLYVLLFFTLLQRTQYPICCYGRIV